MVNAKWVKYRVLLDIGSQSNLVAGKLFNRLGLKDVLMSEFKESITLNQETYEEVRIT